MAHNGYRTLTIAQRDLTVPEFTDWQARYEDAQVGLCVGVIWLLVGIHGFALQANDCFHVLHCNVKTGLLLKESGLLLAGFGCEHPTAHCVLAAAPHLFLACRFFCQNDLGNRDRRMAEEQEKIEVNLHLVGATAVEDKLQVGGFERMPQEQDLVRVLLNTNTSCVCKAINAAA